MIPKFIFFFTFLVCGANQGKVVLQAGVPGADFYLDGNFVAKTDANGNLPMENFPSGTFRFTVKKDGYLPYDGSFRIAEGESKIIQVQLYRVKTPKLVEAPSLVRGAQTETKPIAESSQTEPKMAQPWSARTIAPSREKPAEPTPKPPQKVPTAAAPVIAPPNETQAVEDNSSTAIWAIPGGLAILLFAGFMIRRERAKRRHMLPPIGQMPVIDEPMETVPLKPKHAPKFIDELKRREELIKAGFVGSKPKDVDHLGRREKEIVIVLPKEAYTSEEEK